MSPRKLNVGCRSTCETFIGQGVVYRALLRRGVSRTNMAEESKNNNIDM